MIAKSNHTFYFIHLLADFFIIILAFSASAWISKLATFPSLPLVDFAFLGFLLTVWYFSSRSYILYSTSGQNTQVREVFNTVNCIIIQIMAAIFFIFMVKQGGYSRGFVIIYALILFALMPLAKFFIKRFFAFLYGKGFVRKRAIVIGDGTTGRRFFRYVEQNKLFGYEMVRYINGKLIMRANGSAIDKINNIAIGNGQIGRIDEVFIAESDNGSYDIKSITQILAGYAARLRIVPKMAFQDEFHLPQKITMLGAFPLISVRNEPLEDIYNQNIKRLFDVFFSLFVLVFICTWLFPLVALAIKINSKGPIFYRQERWGKRNRRFLCYKFRSMYTQECDVHNSGKFQQAKKDDARITKVGRILRKTNLDEFPQFINVLKGEMSVVGPRPHASLMNMESLETVQGYLVRHLAKPGITGWAQVNGLRGESEDPTLLQARVAHDIWYIEHWTFLLDLKIVFLTFWKMIVGDKHAY